jgi:CoA:oxalate CoA-transferase
VKAPLEGIRVIEVGHAIAAPHCGQILADHGADVIKIEPPSGERGRAAPPFAGPDSVYFACHNRGKQSVCLDLKSAAGLEALLRLCDGADVLLTNYSVDVPQRLGWSYDVLSERNPRLVFAHITGFGSSSELRDIRAYDGVIQSMSGIPDLTGPVDVPPVLSANFPSDHISAYQATMAILMALVGRGSTGAGSYLDIAMFDSYFATISTDIDDVVRGRPRVRTGNKVLTGFQDTFTTRDGAVFIAPLGEEAWERFCAAIGRPDWRESVSYDDAIGRLRASLDAEVAEWTFSRSSAEVITTMNEAQIACGPVRTVTEAVHAAAAMGRGMVTKVTGADGIEISVPGPPLQYGLTEEPRARAVPGLGADTASVLKMHGYSAQEIEQLASAGVARVAR